MDTTNIALTDQQKKLLVKSSEDRLKELDKEREELIDLLSKLKSVETESKTPIRKQKFTWKSLCLSILEEADELLKTDEVYELALKKYPTELNPDLDPSNKRSKVVGSLSSSLSQLTTNNKVNKVDNPLNTGNFWGLSDWFDGLNPKNEYKTTLENKWDIYIKVETPFLSESDADENIDDITDEIDEIKPY